MDTEKMRACSPLLPAPGGEVVRECLDEIERLRQTCRNVYEVWAGSEGIPQPETAPEAYLLQLVERMRDEAKNGLHNVEFSEGAPLYGAASLSTDGLCDEDKT